MEVTAFVPQHGPPVLDLIVDIQRSEFGIDIDAERQPDLRTIPSFYQVGSGNFWTALQDGQVVGTVALLDIGNGQAALRKMFVARNFRGPQFGTASRLLATLLDWAERQAVREIFLGTTPQFRAAHRFYEKNGFSEISQTELPATFPVMSVDKKFYRRTLKSRTHAAPSKCLS